MIGVAQNQDKSIENKLRWFGHVQRWKSDMIIINETVRSKGRLKLTCDAAIRKYVNLFNLIEHIVLEKTE